MGSSSSGGWVMRTVKRMEGAGLPAACCVERREHAPHLFRVELTNRCSTSTSTSHSLLSNQVVADHGFGSTHNASQCDLTRCSASASTANASANAADSVRKQSSSHQDYCSAKRVTFSSPDHSHQQLSEREGNCESATAATPLAPASRSTTTSTAASSSSCASLSGGRNSLFPSLQRQRAPSDFSLSLHPMCHAAHVPLAPRFHAFIASLNQRESVGAASIKRESPG